MDNRLDIIVFGASGFTGKYTLPYVHQLCKEYENGLKWGVAGRSKDKLTNVLEETANKIGEKSLSDRPIILADVTNEESIIKMTSCAKVIINCCGPYQKYGEVVVKSCIQTGTHYVDVTAEVFFQELMELKYQQAAEIKGVYIISACGFGSIGSELGISFLTNVFSGTLNSVEIIYLYSKGKKLDEGPLFHYATLDSVVNGLAMTRNLMSLQRYKNLKPLPDFYPSLWSRFPFTKAANMGKPNKFVVPLHSPDQYVVERSQRYFYEKNRQRPIQVKFYTLMNTWIFVLLAMFYICIVLVLCQFQCGRNLILKYPSFFTNGYISHDDPSEETLNNSVANMYFYGQGWSDRVLDTSDSKPLNKSILAQLTVRNPGYGFTCLAVSLAAFVILTETSKMPLKGGLYSPSAAFHDTSYMDELQKRSNSMNIIEIKDI